MSTFACKLSNDFSAARLVSLSKLKAASEINPRDRGGPYVVMQDGYDPADPAMVPGEFLLGRSGLWLATAWFVRLPVPERRKEYIFGTAAEVIELMGSLTGTAKVLRPDGAGVDQNAPVDEEMQRALRGSGA